MSAARGSRNPLRWVERKLFAFYGPADVRGLDSTRSPAPPPPTGPETVAGETVHREPGALGGVDPGPGGPTGASAGEAAGEVVRGELVPPAVGPAPDGDDAARPHP